MAESIKFPQEIYMFLKTDFALHLCFVFFSPQYPGNFVTPTLQNKQVIIYFGDWK